MHSPKDLTGRVSFLLLGYCTHGWFFKFSPERWRSATLPVFSLLYMLWIHGEIKYKWRKLITVFNLLWKSPVWNKGSLLCLSFLPLVFFALGECECELTTTQGIFPKSFIDCSQHSLFLEVLIILGNILKNVLHVRVVLDLGANVGPDKEQNV